MTAVEESRIAALEWEVGRLRQSLKALERWVEAIDERI